MNQDVAWLQLGATSILALASVIVAILSYRMTRINTIGMKPIVIVATHDTEHESYPGQSGLLLTIHAEVWNRRKYPIRILKYDCEFTKAFLDTEAGLEMFPPEDGKAFIGKSYAIFYTRHTVSPTTKLDLPILIPILGYSSMMGGAVVVTIYAFDPVRRRNINLKARYQIYTPVTWIDRIRKWWFQARRSYKKLDEKK